MRSKILNVCFPKFNFKPSCSSTFSTWASMTQRQRQSIMVLLLSPTFHHFLALIWLMDFWENSRLFLGQILK
jgi:hypothetical protein